MEVLVRSIRVSPPVLDKANEFVRRVQVKYSSTIQPSCVAAVCLELACRIHAEPIDRVSRWSGGFLKLVDLFF